MSEETATPVILEPVYEVTHSPTIGKLVLALAKAQLNFKPVLKQNENAAFTRGNRVSYYADLATYIDATQEALAKEELVVLQWPDVTPEAKSMTLVSILAHSSGEWMRGRITLPATGRDGFTAQSCGSSITYARRYSYAAITGCASEDDDGNAASGRGTAEAAKEVGERKVAELKKKANGEPTPTMLFYVEPPEHNGHFAEFINLKEFGRGLNEVAAEGLRQVLKPYIAKITKADTILVSTSKLNELCEKLTGDAGITVKRLEAPRA
jgi:hypothetical protein